jgi:hypothetical protein
VLNALDGDLCIGGGAFDWAASSSVMLEHE